MIRVEANALRPECGDAGHVNLKRSVPQRAWFFSSPQRTLCRFHARERGRRPGFSIGVAATRDYLVQDPRIRARETILQRRIRPPAELLLDQAIVGVSTADAQGPGNVPDAEILAGDFHDHLGQLIDAHHLLGTDVDGPDPVRAHEAENTLETLVDIQE